MLDINYIRNNVSTVKKAVSDKLMSVDIDRLLELDALIRDTTATVDLLRAERNSLSKHTPQLHGTEKDAAIGRVKAIKEELSELESKLFQAKSEFDAIMLTVPSVPAPEVPIGKSDEDNVEIRRWGRYLSSDFLSKTI